MPLSLSVGKSFDGFSLETARSMVALMDVSFSIYTIRLLLLYRSKCLYPGLRIVGPSNSLHLTLVLSLLLLLVRHSDKSSIGDKASPAARNSSEVAGTYGA